MEAVLDVYERPYNAKNPVVGLDESPKQLISQVREGFTDSKGVIYEDYEYKREGVADLYVVCEALQGRREIFVKDNHNRLSWAEVVRFVAEEMYPEADKITIVEDNLAAHKPSALYEIMTAEKARQILRRLEFVHTPKHGSWLNVAEIEIGLLKRLGIAERVGSRQELEKQVGTYQKKRNAKQVKIDWHFTTTDARVKLKRLYPSIQPWLNTSFCRFSSSFSSSSVSEIKAL